jgi:hypothetical protein
MEKDNVKDVGICLFVNAAENCGLYVVLAGKPVACRCLGLYNQEYTKVSDWRSKRFTFRVRQVTIICYFDGTAGRVFSWPPVTHFQFRMASMQDCQCYVV